MKEIDTIAAAKCPTRVIAATGATDTVKIPAYIIDDGKKPKFTPRQLIALAILSKEKRSADFDQILQWLHGNFVYYQKTLSTPDLEGWLRTYYNPKVAANVSLSKTLREELLDENNRYERVFQARGDIYSIVPGAERLIFASFNIDPVPFPFMRLPAEIRAMIFRYVLQYSTYWARLSVNKDGSLYRNRVSMGIPRPNITFPPMASILTLLLVSKQVSLEALPIFYFYNYFKFDSMRILATFLKRMGRTRREHLAHVAIECSFKSEQNTGAISAFRLLAECKRLRTFRFTATSWNGAKVENLGFHQLRFLRGLEEVVVDFYGVPEQALSRTREVEAMMQLPKPQETPKPTKTAEPKKRKATAAAEGGTGEPTKKRSNSKITTVPA